MICFVAGICWNREFAKMRFVQDGIVGVSALEIYCMKCGAILCPQILTEDEIELFLIHQKGDKLKSFASKISSKLEKFVEILDSRIFLTQVHF